MPRDEKIDNRAVRLVNSTIETLNVANEILMNIDTLSLEESEKYKRKLLEGEFAINPVNNKDMPTPKEYLIDHIEKIIEDLNQLKKEIYYYNIIKGNHKV